MKVTVKEEVNDNVNVTTESITTTVVTGPQSTPDSLVKLKLNEINDTLADIDSTLQNLLISQSNDLFIKHFSVVTDGSRFVLV